MSIEPYTDSGVTLTEHAANQAKRLMKNDPEAAGKNLRVYAEGGCCSGIQYGLVFDDRHPEDMVADFHGVTLLIDPDSARCLRGAVIDYCDDPGDSGFRISNLSRPGACDCGKPFEA
ncbi:MAG TPA: iron-sulfur cluster assembly accessory protein [Candidatus Paceibacterota bacterium]|nr:iron-sulfur cluster assembly accessory protein [Candidatus Paceibacterota bacterium]